MKDKIELRSEIRYAIRLCERTARLYRNVQTASTCLTIIGGSAAFAAVSGAVPDWLSAAGAVIFAVFGAALVSIRPSDKAAQNEADMRKYQALLAKAQVMSEAELSQALEEARLGNAPEIEPLRDVAYNDVAIELGRPDAVVPLSPVQQFLSKLAW